MTRATENSSGVPTRTVRRGMTPLWTAIVKMTAYEPWRSAARSTLELLRKGAPLVVMLLTKAFYDIVQGQGPAGLSLGGAIALGLVAELAVIGADLLRSAAGGALGFRVQGLLRRNVFARILELPGARALPGSVGEAISTLRDDADALEQVSDLPLDVLTNSVAIAGGLAILASVDVQVTLLVFVPMLAVMALSEVGKWRLEQVRTQSREAAARFNGALGEVLSSVQAVQVARAETHVVAHLNRLGRVKQKAMLRDWLQQSSWHSLFGFGNTLGTGLVLLAAAAKMRSGAFTVGDMALFGRYVDEIAEFLVFGGSNLVGSRLARVGLRRLRALMQGAPVERLVEHHPRLLREPPLAVPTAGTRAKARLERLEVCGLTLRHPGSDDGIEDVSFALERGTLTAVVGRVGAGKTTVLRALLGLLPIDDGEIRWNGEAVPDPATFMQPPRAGYTPQVPTLLSGTLGENILLGEPDEGEGLARAVEGAVLERDVAELPHGLDTVIGVRGMKLSGGQAQRAAAARMLVREPELLVLDDISSALDVETERVLWERIFGRARGETTCLVVSHRRAVLERADLILLLEGGRITARGKLEDLLARSEEMRRLYAVEGEVRPGCETRFDRRQEIGYHGNVVAK